MFLQTSFFHVGFNAPKVWTLSTTLSLSLSGLSDHSSTRSVKSHPNTLLCSKSLGAALSAIPGNANACAAGRNQVLSGKVEQPRSGFWFEPKLRRRQLGNSVQSQAFQLTHTYPKRKAIWPSIICAIWFLNVPYKQITQPLRYSVLEKWQPPLFLLFIYFSPCPSTPLNACCTAKASASHASDVDKETWPKYWFSSKLPRFMAHMDWILLYSVCQINMITYIFVSAPWAYFVSD